MAGQEDSERLTATTSVRLRPGVSCVPHPGGGLYLAAWPHGRHLPTPTPAQRELLARLAAGACRGDGLTGEERELAELLERGGWLETTFLQGGRPLYGVLPVKPLDTPGGPPPRGVDPRWRLSRFALLRRDSAGMVLESPCASADILIHDSALLGLLGGPDGAGGTPPAGRFWHDLWRTGFLVEEDGGEEPRLRHWKVHDLWFHTRSRSGSRGRPRHGFGATSWGRGRFPQPPARRTASCGPVIDLHVPDLAGLRDADPGLTALVEDRESVRVHDDGDPLTLRQLGEFLYRCARVRDVTASDGMQLVNLPYPSAGALGELDLYLVVRRVAGLDPGLYRYDGHAHRLERRPADAAARRQLVRDAAASAGGAPPPQVVIVVAARFARLMWKYEGMAYAAVLKDVGVLFELMYLVATAMSVAGCALGAGNAELFSEAAGLDRFEESSVGEFLLGSARPPRTVEGGADGVPAV
ncbi:SagB/ThcOx family dehydrogenase [Nonomuraea mesophila]|uniref:SagB/ThcOx family dehydrogenase n=1 Tax=Nonomuraea mesophila TaxID=2530382 RepID=A0A4R5FIH1_9ACTN|nr:SagB family peptide dehydrogenase [Nonomuraea mesophila]TDE51537.1 SagB/ThcOx family dehydrogenase [Nonomuraea mesophila]